MERRIPFVGPMKSGKSSLLCALVRHDVLPRRSHVMTTVATRVVLGEHSHPALRIDQRLVDRISEQLNSPVDMENLSRWPDLARFHHRVRQGGIEVRTQTHGAEGIRRQLHEINELARLGGRAVDWLPEIRLPGGTGLPLVFIDTPGVAPHDAVVPEHLAQAHGCVVVLDYTQLGSTEEAVFAERLQPLLDRLDRVWIVVNRVDQRRQHADRNCACTADAARALFGRDDLEVFETSAELAMAAGPHARTRSGVQLLSDALICVKGQL
ncbi:dynamin family protein [Streptomyces sp. WSLK1-5]|uniref:dynamin family protein n=1 Tax=unclassified Streptomyces TaxID=2593676 RepID=UPI00379BFF21